VNGVLDRVSKPASFRGIVAAALAVWGLACTAGSTSDLFTTPTGAGGARGGGGSGGGNGGAVSGGAGSSGAGAAGQAGTGNAIENLPGSGAGMTMPPVAALITDFSDAIADGANPGQFKFGGGVSTKVQGGTSVFADTTETKPALAITDGALSVSATSKGSYAGVVLYMNGPDCVDGSAYTGVAFDLYGDLGSCTLTFGFGFADDLTASSDAQRGICTSSSCYIPSVAVKTTGPIEEPYTAVSGGNPDMSVDKQKLTGVQWQIQSPAIGTTCTATFTLDNVTFY
jgi:hypothetical protein